MQTVKCRLVALLVVVEVLSRLILPMVILRTDDDCLSPHLCNHFLCVLKYFRMCSVENPARLSRDIIFNVRLDSLLQFTSSCLLKSNALFNYRINASC